MTELGTGRRLEIRVAHQPEFVSRVMWISASLSLLAAAVGVVTGIVLGTYSIVVPCTPDDEIPLTGDQNCYSYPHASIGVGLVVLSVIGGALVVLACITLVSLAAVRREIGWGNRSGA